MVESIVQRQDLIVAVTEFVERCKREKGATTITNLKQEAEQLLESLQSTDHVDAEQARKKVKDLIVELKMTESDLKFIGKYKNGKSMDQGGYHWYHYASLALPVVLLGSWYYAKHLKK